MDELHKRNEEEDGSWEANEVGMRKGGRKCEQGEKAWMLCGWEVKYKIREDQKCHEHHD